MRSLRVGVRVVMAGFAAAVIAIVAFVGRSSGVVPAAALTTAPNQPQVFVVRADGQGLRQVTAGSVSHRVLSWMPGYAAVAEVASTHFFLAPGRAWVESRGTDGSGHRDLSPQVYSPFPQSVALPWSFAYSAASRLTIFETCCGPSIYTLGIVGGLGSRSRKLDSWPIPDGAYSAAAWSPNGRLIAYAHSSGPVSIHDPSVLQSLAVIAPGGQHRRILTEGPVSDDVPPLFSRNGQSILFCGAGSHPGLYTVPTRGGPPHQITQGRCGDAVAWSPDGREIAYIGNAKGSQTPYLFVVNVLTGAANRLAGPVQNLNVTSPVAWSPDGKKIAFAGSAAVETINVNGTGIRKLVEIRHSETFSLAWSRDSKQIAFTLRRFYYEPGVY